MRSQPSRRYRVHLTGALLAGLVATCIFSSCSRQPIDSRESSFRLRPHIQVTPDLARCAELVDSYVSSTKHWAKADYKLTLAPARGAATSFEVHHIDDYLDPHVGGGKSIRVEADCSSNKIVRELAYQ